MKTMIAGIETDFVGTASGCWDTTDKQVYELASACAFFSLKSCTVEPRIGNAEPRYSSIPNGSSIQSIGLANRGLKETLKTLASIKEKYGDTVKVKASIAGFSLEENIELMAAFQDSKADFIEVNISCPNTGGKILAHDFNGIDDYLNELVDYAEVTPIGLKLPFYGSMHAQLSIVEIIKKHNIQFITAINSIPGLWIDTSHESTVIAPNSGTGGVGGSCILPFALNECRNYYHMLKGTGISLIGVGGVSSGVDAYRFLLAGCDACEVGSYLEANGPETIDLINHTLRVMLKNKGYSSIAEAKGNLKLIGNTNEH